MESRCDHVSISGFKQSVQLGSGYVSVPKNGLSSVSHVLDISKNLRLV